VSQFYCDILLCGLDETVFYYAFFRHGSVLNVTVIDNVILSAVLISKYSPAAIRA
jgi:hypothetical protein